MGKNSIKIRNLFRFGLLFSKYADSSILKQSPDYVLEKYNLLIGFKPKYDIDFSKEIYPKNILIGMNLYIGKWGIESFKKVYPQVLFILFIDENLNLKNILKYFDYFIGDIRDISDENYNLHPNLESFVDKLVESSEKDIMKLERDMKISDIF